MKKSFSSIRLSAREFGNVRTTAVCGMLLALRLVLSLFTVDVTPLLKVGFSFLPVAAAGMLFGPVAGGVVAALGDLIGSFIKPTGAYFPGFTLNAFITGFLYGLILYHRPVKLLRTFAAVAAASFGVSLLLTPLWLALIYGKAFWAVVSARFLTNLVMLPVQTALLYALLKVLEKCHVPQKS